MHFAAYLCVRQTGYFARTPLNPEKLNKNNNNNNIYVLVFASEILLNGKLRNEHDGC